MVAPVWLLALLASSIMVVCARTVLPTVRLAQRMPPLVLAALAIILFSKRMVDACILASVESTIMVPVVACLAILLVRLARMLLPASPVKLDSSRPRLLAKPPVLWASFPTLVVDAVLALTTVPRALELPPLVRAAVVPLPSWRMASA